MKKSLKEKINKKVHIVDLLKMYGVEINENHKCLCPFHNEDTPSFHVYQETNTFKCYGCGQKGDIFDFVMLMDEIDFLQAFNKLANIAGISAHENNDAEIPLEDLLIKVNSDLNIIDLVVKLGLEPDQSKYITSFYSPGEIPIKLFPEENLFCCPSPAHSGNVIQFFSDHQNISIQDAASELNRMIENKEITISKYKNRFFKNCRLDLAEDEKDRFTEALNKYITDYQLDEKIARQLATDIILGRRKYLSIYIYSKLKEFCIGPDDESMEYLTGPKRGLDVENINKFGVFSISNYNETSEYLRNLDHITLDHLRLVGLFNEKGNFVFYKHKIIIPFFENNSIAYLRGRFFHNSSDVPPEKSDKYLGLSNFSGLLSAKRFFNKDLLLNTPEGTNILICEGEFDTMIAKQNGINALGILGVNNFPEHQIELLNNYKVYLCLDNDKTGADASNKIASLFGRPVKAVKLRKHKDLTELFSHEN